MTDSPEPLSAAAANVIVRWTTEGMLASSLGSTEGEQSAAQALVGGRLERLLAASERPPVDPNDPSWRDLYYGLLGKIADEAAHPPVDPHDPLWRSLRHTFDNAPGLRPERLPVDPEKRPGSADPAGLAEWKERHRAEHVKPHPLVYENECPACVEKRADEVAAGARQKFLDMRRASPAAPEARCATCGLPDRGHDDSHGFSPATPRPEGLDVERLMREFDAIADGIDELQDEHPNDPAISAIASRARECYRILARLSDTRERPYIAPPMVDWMAVYDGDEPMPEGS